MSGLANHSRTAFGARRAERRPGARSHLAVPGAHAGPLADDPTFSARATPSAREVSA
ncbi:hypothetical protein ACIQMJ_00170 [Actinosynnema sp. NPDC091369]